MSDLLRVAERLLEVIDGGGGYDGGFDISPSLEDELRAAVKEEREFPTAARIAELERLHLEAQNRIGDLLTIIGDIEQCRAVEGDSVTILCDNPEADSLGMQSAVEVCGDYTGYELQRIYGATWKEAIARAARVARRHYTDDAAIAGKGGGE
jgi:hypothetical protein